MVLLINPNSNPATTAMMHALAQHQLTGHSLQLVSISAAGTPPMITHPVALQESVGPVLTAVRGYLAGPRGHEVAAIIIGAMGDPGRAELATELGIPVIGIGQAAILAAASTHRPFAMATSTPDLVSSLTDLVESHGCAEHFLGVELTSSCPLELATDPEAQFVQLRDAARRGHGRGARAVIIAGGPLSETARRIARGEDFEVIEPIPSACRMMLRALDL
ncbi:MAG: aspartate/glutamate racemase family protein [Micrococcaceae bacterium]|nr:aspartate/glutamate racemase family protein [Micrococcaceae bacterium]